MILTTLYNLCLHLQAPIQRRQLTQLQQNQILTDVQQHQHRFNLNSNPQFRNQQFNGRQQPNFVQQQSQSVAFPPQTARLQQLPPNQQPPPAFRPNVRQVNSFTPHIPLFVRLLKLLFTQNPVPVAPQQNIRQTQFQRSVQNQVGQAGFNQPQPQFNQFQQTANNPFAQQEQFQSFNRPVASPLIQQQQLPVRPQANFHPSNQIAFPQQQQTPFIPNNFAPEPSRQVQSPQFNAPQGNFQQQNTFQQPQNNFQQPQRNPFLQSSQALPLEQRANLFLDSRTEEQRQKEQQLRQKLIEKQEKFTQKYYQKQQQQVQELHQEFLQKQQAIQKQAEEKIRPQQAALIQQQQNFNRHQGVQPTDFSAFEKSVNQYYKQNPTTTTTTQAPVTTSSPLLTVVPLKKTKSKSEIKTLNAEDIQQLLGSRQGLFGASKTETAKKTKTAKSASPINKEDLLRQLQQQILNEGGPEGTQDIVLPNGEKVQVIRTSDPELIRKAKSGNANVFEQTLSTTTQAPISFEDLANGGILPPGADFEVIKQSEDGLQKVKKVPQQKKVTFVYLEEQDDGSYKVQGVKGNGDKEAKRSGAEVDSILKRIKNGEIQLPPAAKGAEKPIEIPTPTPTPSTTQKQTSYRSTQSASSSTALPKNHRASSNSNQLVRSSTVAPQTVTPSRQSTRGSSIFQYSFSATTPKADDEGRSPYSTLPTFGTSERNNFLSVSPRVQRLSSTSEHPEYVTASSINYVHNVDAQKFVSSTRGHSVSPTSAAPSSIFSSPSYSPTFSTTPPSTFATSSTAAPELSNILRNKGLFAMAKYLKQSGLDSILNETGPYTIFAPTDKAFKSLLVQLGGPEKAEEKFKNNPRLLSGLLLHHVIPGSFKIEDLQDEMTGVSLAGTQLRVNQYQMQDTEWNDVKLTTINGATVANDNNDIVIPQGVAHSVDRVMFPLPVGDILQSLQSDRERRFTNFLRAVFASNMADTLQNKGECYLLGLDRRKFHANISLPGIKTYTVFAPTDAAFSALSTEELNTMVSEKESAKKLVERHILPGTLFTSGMRFYQVKDTLAEDKSITVQKNGGACGWSLRWKRTLDINFVFLVISGKVKVNESTIITSNIPSTNGVIHAIDTLL